MGRYTESESTTTTHRHGNVCAMSTQEMTSGNPKNMT